MEKLYRQIARMYISVTDIAVVIVVDSDSNCQIHMYTNWEPFDWKYIDVTNFIFIHLKTTKMVIGMLM